MGKRNRLRSRLPQLPSIASLAKLVHHKHLRVLQVPIQITHMDPNRIRPIALRAELVADVAVALQSPTIPGIANARIPSPKLARLPVIGHGVIPAIVLLPQHEARVPEHGDAADALGVLHGQRLRGREPAILGGAADGVHDDLRALGVAEEGELGVGARVVEVVGDVAEEVLGAGVFGVCVGGGAGGRVDEAERVRVGNLGGDGVDETVEPAA